MSSSIVSILEKVLPAFRVNLGMFPPFMFSLLDSFLVLHLYLCVSQGHVCTMYIIMYMYMYRTIIVNY